MAKKKSKPKKWESMTPAEQYRHFHAKYESHIAKAQRRYQQCLNAYYQGATGTAQSGMPGGRTLLNGERTCCASCDGHACPERNG